MKKFIVSSFVIVTFVAYSLYQRVFGMHASPVIIPKNIGTIPSDAASPTPSLLQTSTPSPTRQISPISITPTSQPSTPTLKPSSQYKDGSYTGDPADAFYGNIQVQATVTNGRITDVKFLQYPNDRSTSIEINSQADPMLAQEAIQAQSASVDIVSGATDSSNAFIQSLQSALNKAKN